VKSNFIEIRQPGMEDIELITQLNTRYLLTHLTDSQKQNGFLGKLYSREELWLIVADKQIIIATDEGKIAGYYLVGRKDDPDASAYKRNKALQLCDESGAPFSTLAYPTQVCIDEAYRGKGLFGKMLSALMTSVKEKYSSVLCSIAENNPASIKAHLDNGWQLINTFESRKFFIYKT
jgi:ribosomal protein S18 acetylase RimI-like enzyme